MEVATAIVGWLQPVWNLMILIGILIGVALSGLGLYKIASASFEQHAAHKRLGWMSLLFGVILVNTSGALNTLSLSIFNQSTQSAIGYTPSGGGQYAIIVQAALGIVSLVGLYGVVSGLLKLKGGGQQDEFWHGVRRLVGGTLAVNIVPALHVLGASLGGTMQSVITKLIG